MNNSITRSELKNMLDYDPGTGIFIWINSNRASVNGKIAGAITTGGYVTISINGSTYPAHRLAWLYMTGEWPSVEIDHINLQTDDNRWINLREATHSQNGSHTIRKQKGVRQKPSGKWEARIRVNKEEIYLGSFRDKEDAELAFAKACDRYRGEFSTP